MLWSKVFLLNNNSGSVHLYLMKTFLDIFISGKNHILTCRLLITKLIMWILSIGCFAICKTCISKAPALQFSCKRKVRRDICNFPLYFIDEETEAHRDLLRSHSQLVSEPGGPVRLLHSLNNCISSLLVMGLFHKLWWQ